MCSRFICSQDKVLNNGRAETQVCSSKQGTDKLRVRFFGKIQIRIIVSQNGFCVSLPKSENGVIRD